MAIRFVDGFDVLTAANLDLKWDVSSGTIVTGIYGKGSALNNYNQTKTLGANYATGMVAFHYYTGTTVSAATILTFLDAAVDQVDLRYNAGGQLYFTRNGTTIGSMTSFALVPNQWYWMEIQVTISSSSGVANLYVNGVSYLSGSSLNTQTSANAYFGQINVRAQINGTQNIDNFHFWDTVTGIDVSSFPYGEHLIDSKLATGAGDQTQWSNVGASANYLCINNVSNQALDNQYVYTNTSGSIDSYAFANLAETSGTIGTVAVNALARVDDGMTHVLQLFTQSSAAQAFSANLSPGATYFNYQEFFGVDPHTNASWSITGRNNAVFGQKLVV